MNRRILVVDDDRNMCDLIETDLGRRGFDAQGYTSSEEAFTRLKDEEFDAVLTDLNMPGISGIDLCERIKANWPDVPVVVITAFGSMDAAISAIRAGAYDFVNKPIEMELLAITLERAIKHRSLQKTNKILQEAVNRSHHFAEFIGASPAMKDIYGQIERIGDTDITVLITGESGTGKELAARALHKESSRKGKPFVPVNCTALPEMLLESELFGHKKGAFTGASEARKGLFQHAEGGTLFLDEIGEFPIALQPKLLRVFEERTVRPVGSDKEETFDARIIVATNRDLESAVHEGRFREDLYFRVNVIKIQLPPLRARGTDVLLLAQHFLAQFAAQTGRGVAGITDAVAEKLLNYSWPGNVRELRNVMERAVALTKFENVTVEDLPEKIRAYNRSHVLVGSNDPSELVSMEEVERRYILHVLGAVCGNKTHAARVLGFDRKTLYRKLQSFGEGDDS